MGVSRKYLKKMKDTTEMLTHIIERFDIDETDIYQFPDDPRYKDAASQATHYRLCLRKTNFADDFYIVQRKSNIYLVYRLAMDCGCKLEGIELKTPHANSAKGAIMHTPVMLESAQTIKIFDRINAGQTEDWLDPNTKDIWKVSDYLAKGTPYVEVYSCGGRFKGRAFRNQDEAERWWYNSKRTRTT